MTTWYNPEQTSYSFQSERCTFGRGSFGLQLKISLTLNGMGIYFPIAKSRFNLIKRNAVQESLRSNSFPGSLFFYETGRAETLWTRFRCVTTWFNVTRYSSSSVTKLLLIDTFGYMDRNSRTSSLDSREQKETSSSFKCLHCFNNLPKKKTQKKTKTVFILST